RPPLSRGPAPPGLAPGPGRAAAAAGGRAPGWSPVTGVSAGITRVADTGLSMGVTRIARIRRSANAARSGAPSRATDA
ncbi:hypothetical protein, partial [Streptomyces sp. NPDC059668]|uniref:hypothetical protein n=1 Tax=Streptomyces sp. NPDC059668 TaxID=3346900 RepID=UPI0036CF2A9F